MNRKTPSHKEVTVLKGQTFGSHLDPDVKLSCRNVRVYLKHLVQLHYKTLKNSDFLTQHKGKSSVIGGVTSGKEQLTTLPNEQFLSTQTAEKSRNEKICPTDGTPDSLHLR